MKLMKKHTLIIACLALAALVGISTASAEEFIVTNGNASGAGSLRQAVLDANSNGDSSVTDLISFQSKVKEVVQDDLDLHDLTGPIQITQSVDIVGPGRHSLTIDGKFAWIDHAGQESGHPNDPESTILIRSGTLFEVGEKSLQNNIHVLIRGLTIKGTNGAVEAWGGAHVELSEVNLTKNAEDQNVVRLGSGLIAMHGPGGSLVIDAVSMSANTWSQHMVSSNAEMTQVLGSLMQSNNFTSDTTGMKLFGKTVYIDSSVFADFEDNNWFWAEDIYIMNSKFSRPGGRNYAKIWASQTNIRFNNVTFHIPRINKSLDIGQPTHLYAVDSKLYLANTVIDAYSPPDSTNHLPYVMLQTGATVWLDVNNFVGDGSLTGAASGHALLDSGSRPMSGSPLIDAGDDDHAINPLTNQELEHDLGGNPRISGVRVDIGAYEAQQFFAINDAYSTQENTSLTVPARGVLLNDTYDAPGTLKGNAIKIFGGPQHGVIGVAGRNGGFIYIPETNFHGTDTFKYFAQFTDPVGITNVATVKIIVAPIDDPPVANPDFYETVEGQTLTVNAPGVLGNDTDPDNLPPTAPNAGLTAKLGTYPSDGTLVWAIDGSFGYIPGAPGTYVFTYKAVDPQGAESVEAAEVTLVVHPTGTELGHEGLSHGYWKRHPDAWHGTVSYEGDHGGVPIIKSIEGDQSVAYHFSAAADYGLGGFTMEEALSFKGGKGLQGAARNLLKQAVAALLNAAHHNVRYPWSIDEVIEAVDAALASGDRHTILDLAEELDEYNNLGGDI